MGEEPRVITKALRPRARLLVLLGDQLIRDANMAVFEMVKNAYDADASLCTVELKNVAQPDPASASIVVEDNGVGMSLDTIVNHWLEPGTDNRSEQKKNSVRTKRGRLPLGEKGVGRFAAHKLGRRITLVTRARDSKEVIVEVDWDKFDPPTAEAKPTDDSVKSAKSTEQRVEPEIAKSGKEEISSSPLYLDQIPIEVKERDPAVFTGRQTGTRITVSHLREVPWDRRAARSLHRSVTSICSPVDDESSFDVALSMSPDHDWLKGLLTVDKVLDHAPFRFTGVLKGTHLFYEYTFNPGSKLARKRVTQRTSKVSKFPILRNPHPDEKNENPLFDSLIQKLPEDLLSTLPPDTRKKGILVDLEAHGLGAIGIDFHIYDLDRHVIELTLGDPRQLRGYLDENGGVRVYRDNIRVFDFGEPGNDWLDLEGRRVNTPTGRIGNNQIIGVVFLSTEGSRPLVEKTNREGFVENAAYKALQDAVACAVAQAAAERNEDKGRLRRALQGPNDKEPVVDEIQEIRVRLRERKLEKDFDDILRRIELEHKRFRDTMLLAAGTGLNLAAVIHQVEKDIKLLGKLVKSLVDMDVIEEVVDRLGRMTDTMAWLLSDEPTGLVQASQLVRQSLNTWRFRFEHHNIAVTNGFELAKACPEVQRTMSRKLMSTALMNLLDNAIYWVGTQADNRRIYVGTSMDVADGPAIVVADNGPGLQGDDPEALVQAFYTRKPGGTGLGLHIANEVMKQHGGRVIFPARGDVDLPRGFGGACIALAWDK